LIHYVLRLNQLPFSFRNRQNLARDLHE